VDSDDDVNEDDRDGNIDFPRNSETLRLTLIQWLIVKCSVSHGNYVHCNDGNDVNHFSRFES